VQKFGIPAQLLPAVIVLELGGGLLIAAGALTRLVAPAFAIFCALTAALFHTRFADGNQLLHFQKDLAIAGGFLVLAVSGPGYLSADRYLGLSSWLNRALMRRKSWINARNVGEASPP
jgi:putative oxidoreductase